MTNSSHVHSEQNIARVVATLICLSQNKSVPIHGEESCKVLGISKKGSRRKWVMVIKLYFGSIIGQ